MAQDDDIADDVIPGSLKRSESYHSAYGKKTYKEIKDLAAANPPDQKATAEREEAAVMSTLRGFKQKLSTVSRLWDKKEYDTALAEVESLLESWPGNAHLHVLWASLVQLQEEPQHDLEEARQALQQAVELDKGSPAAAIELGHFLDTVEDDPHAAAKVYAEGVPAARHLLIDGLIGQAKVFRQLDKREEFLHCLLEVLHLTRFETAPKRTRTEESGADAVFESPTGHFFAVQLKGPYAEQIQDLLSEAVTDHSA